MTGTMARQTIRGTLGVCIQKVNLFIFSDHISCKLVKKRGEQSTHFVG